MKKRILLVSPNSFERESLAEMLCDGGYEVIAPELPQPAQLADAHAGKSSLPKRRNLLAHSHLPADLCRFLPTFTRLGA
jgi:hypothetical protein